MIITKTPLRISFTGGGSDLPHRWDVLWLQGSHRAARKRRWASWTGECDAKDRPLPPTLQAVGAFFWLGHRRMSVRDVQQ